MNRIFPPKVLVLAAVFSFFLIALGMPTVGANESLEESGSAQAAIEAFYKAIEAGDTEALEALIAADWSLFMSMTQWQGALDKESWLPGFASMNENGTHVRFKPITKHIGVGDKVAWYRADESVSWVDANGKTQMEAHWLTTGVFEKRDGKWFIVHTHHSFVDDEPKENEDSDDVHGEGEN